MIVDNRIGSEGVNIIIESLEDNDEIESLDLSGKFTVFFLLKQSTENFINDDGAKIIAGFIEKTKSLNSLDLSSKIFNYLCYYQ